MHDIQKELVEQEIIKSVRKISPGLEEAAEGLSSPDTGKGELLQDHGPLIHDTCSLSDGECMQLFLDSFVIWLQDSARIGSQEEGIEKLQELKPQIEVPVTPRELVEEETQTADEPYEVVESAADATLQKTEQARGRHIQAVNGNSVVFTEPTMDGTLRDPVDVSRSVELVASGITKMLDSFQTQQSLILERENEIQQKQLEFSTTLWRSQVRPLYFLCVIRPDVSIYFPRRMTASLK